MSAARAHRTDTALLRRLWSEEVLREQLPNGVTLLIKPDRRSALAAVQVWVKTGSLHEGAHLGAGLSHYLEHLLFKGTAHREGRQLSATIQEHGGYLNAYTTFDRTVYHADMPAEHTGVAVEILADMVLHSTLPAEEVAREKEVILREIAMTQDDPDQRLMETLLETAFHEHPYRHPVIGHREIFAAVTRDELLDYYRTRYAPDNLVVVVAGDVEPEAVRTMVKAHFGGTPRTSLPPVWVPGEPPQRARRSRHHFEDVEIARAGLAWQTPGMLHADSPALDVLALILGQGDSSILWQSLREKQRLVHSIGASCWNPGQVGLFCVSYTCDADKREAATRAVLDELARRQRLGFATTQVRKAVRQLTMGEIHARMTVGGQASRLGTAEVVAGDLDYARDYFERLAALTPAALTRALKTYVSQTVYTDVSLNPKAAPGTTGKARSTVAAGAPDFTEQRLRNGVRLLLQRDCSLPNLHIRLCGLGGPQQEPADRRGATSLLATMLTKDTAKRSAAAVARTIEEVGGSWQAFAGNNSFGLSVEALPADLPRAMELMREAVTAASLRPATLARERDAQLAALREAEDDPVTFGQRRLRQRFFGVHPFAVGAIGDEAGVGATRTGDLAALRRRLLLADNLVLAVAGDFEPKEMSRRCREWLEGLPAGGPVGPGPIFAGPPAPGDYVENRAGQQAVLFAAYPSPVLGAGDFYIGEVMDELFSGMSSRLFERVREEKGLAYFVHAARVTGLQAAMFYFCAGVEPGREAAVYAEIEAEVSRVADGGVDADELRRCQIRLKAARRSGLQTNAARAAQAGLNALYGLPVNDGSDYDSRIDAVGRGDLAVFARKYFEPGRRLRLTVRP